MKSQSRSDSRARLLIRPRPQPGEDFHHFLQRIANANGLSGISRVLGTRGLTFFGKRPTTWYGAVGELLNVPPNVLQHMDIVLDRNAGNRQRFWYHGHSLHVHHLHQHGPRICPVCLKSHGHGKAIWALTAVTACPEHGYQLLDTCPRCDRQLSWRRPDLFRCPCGADLRELPITMASPEAEALCRSIAHAFLPSLYPAVQADGIPAGFLSLPLPELLYHIDRLGRHFAAQQRGLIQPGRRHTAAVRHQAIVTSQVATILMQWPDALHRALINLPRRKPPEDTLWSWQRFALAHCEFFDYALRKEAPEFLSSATRQYIDAHRIAGRGWEGYRPPGTVTQEAKDNDPKLPSTFRKMAIARHLKISLNAVNHLIDRGQIERLVPAGIAGGVFAAGQLETLSEDIQHAIRAPAAADLLGINRHQFACLAGSKLVRPIYGSDRGSQYGHYSSKALLALIERLRSMLRTDSAATSYGWFPLSHLYPNRPRPSHRFSKLVMAIINGQLGIRDEHGTHDIGSLLVQPEEAIRLGLYFPYHAVKGR